MNWSPESSSLRDGDVAEFDQPWSSTLDFQFYILVASCKVHRNRKTKASTMANSTLKDSEAFPSMLVKRLMKSNLALCLEGKMLSRSKYQISCDPMQQGLA